MLELFTLKSTPSTYRQFMLTNNFVFVLRKSAIMLISFYRNMNSTMALHYSVCGTVACFTRSLADQRIEIHRIWLSWQIAHLSGTLYVCRFNVINNVDDDDSLCTVTFRAPQVFGRGSNFT